MMDGFWMNGRWMDNDGWWMEGCNWGRLGRRDAASTLCENALCSLTGPQKR